MNGVLIVDKPQGYTSHDIVNIIRKSLNIKKVGHTGTLDPNATGVLPILIGDATKISKYLIEHDKSYVAELKLGKRTTTGDNEGEIVEEKVVPQLSKDYIETVLQTFIGKQTQTPPIYSSIKVNGKKAYEYARQGKKIELNSRKIEIYNIKQISFENNTITFKVSCSKGTYIRVLCEDIAKKLNTVGYMNNLRRLQVDKFNIDKAITIEKIKVNTNILKNIISIEEIFKDYSDIKLDNYKLNLFLNGVKLTRKEPDGVYRIYNNEQFIGIGVITDTLLKRDVIISK